MVADGQRAGEATVTAKDKATVWPWTCCSPFSTDVLALCWESRHSVYKCKRQFNAKTTSELPGSTLQQSSNFSLFYLCLKGKGRGGIWLSSKSSTQENPFQFAKCQSWITDIQQVIFSLNLNVSLQKSIIEPLIDSDHTKHSCSHNRNLSRYTWHQCNTRSNPKRLDRRQMGFIICRTKEQTASTISFTPPEQTSVSLRLREAEGSILNFQAAQQLKSVLLELSLQRVVD